MPYQKIDGTDLSYALISFDGDGRERTDDPNGGTFSKVLVERAKTEKPTNIFLFSHGWKGDVPAAVDQYNRWIGAMWKLEADRKAMGPNFKPMFIGLHWPSQPWGTETMPVGTSFAAGGAPAGPALDALLEQTVQHFGDKPGVRAALKVIFEAQKANPGAFAVPDEVVTAYKDLAGAIGFSAGSDANSAPDNEGAALDPEQAIRADRVASSAVAFGSGGGGFLGGLLGGLRQLSFWMMKHRARTVGEQGMHQVVAAFQKVCDAQIHLMGHSFGCVVVSSILGGPGGNTKLPRPVQSAALVQGALSLWSYADAVPGSQDSGYFRNVLTNKIVAGPVITTQSSHDLAVAVYYPAAVGLVGEAAFGVGAATLPKYGGVGTFGVQGTKIAQSLKLQDEKFTYAFKAGAIYNLESSQYIAKMDGASGAHSDIDGPQVAHALWQAALPSATETTA